MRRYFPFPGGCKLWPCDDACPHAARSYRPVQDHATGSRRLSAGTVVRTLACMQIDYIDPRSGAAFPLDQPRWCGPGRAPLLLTPFPGLNRTQIDTGTRSLWRYRAAFPLSVEQPITLGEGCTPLIARRIGGVPTLLKCVWFNPTCSFKDRGASVMLSLL